MKSKDKEPIAIADDAAYWVIQRVLFVLALLLPSWFMLWVTGFAPAPFEIGQWVIGVLPL